MWRLSHLALGLVLGLLPPLSGAAVEAEPHPEAPVAKTSPLSPDAAKLRILIYNSLIALNQANLTGNYTVLRDLGSSHFKAGNSAAYLGELFADLRRRKVDLAPIVVFEPKLIKQPEVNEQGLLRLTGFFDTAPEQVAFDLVFIAEDGDWRLVGIAAEARSAERGAAASAGKKPATKKQAR